MSARRVALAAVLAWLGSGACDTDLDPGLEGLLCRAQEPRCLPGYTCAADNRCVRGDGVLDGGGAGGGGSGGTDGSAAAGTAGAAGSSDGPGGTGGADPDAGDRFHYDAGPGLDALDASVLPDASACDAPVQLFRDEDEDGFGITAQAVRGCPPLPKWALQGGDCRDDLADVHPSQLDFFSTGYPDPTRQTAGNVSFDYDCNVTEEPAPDVAPDPSCSGLLTCEGSGYLAGSPARTGAGVNAICGSTQLVICQSMSVPLLGLTCSAQPVSGAAPARCR